MTATTDRVKNLQHHQIKDMKTLNNILEGDPVSFTNVRHPFERLVSAYLDKDNTQIEKTFADFVTKIVLKEAAISQNKQIFREMNPHWRPYNTYCAFCNIEYKIISKTETFAEDRRRILETLGLEKEKEGVRINAHGGDKTVELTREYFKNITDDVKIALVDLYKYEFAMFDYDPELY